MVQMQPIRLDNGYVIGVEVNYPKTKLLSIIAPEIGYIMCGVLHIEAMDELHPEREIIAARITGVRSFNDLLKAEVRGTTKKAAQIGIKQGMTGEEALNIMLEYGGA
jgi:uncharacterized protein YunC (DUF1805 family)